MKPKINRHNLNEVAFTQVPVTARVVAAVPAAAGVGAAAAAEAVVFDLFDIVSNTLARVCHT